MTGVSHRLTAVTILLLLGGCTRSGAPPRATGLAPGPASSAPSPGLASASAVAVAPVGSAATAAAAFNPPPGYSILAHARSPRGSWSFALEPLDGRTLLSACLVSSGGGCAAVELREAVGSGWSEVQELVSGLPELGRVNLRAEAKSLWRTSIPGGAGPGGEQPACAGDQYLLGTRSIETVVGHWPDNAWIVLTEQAGQWASRTSQLYRWQGRRWTLVFSSSQVGAFIESLVPWRNGVAGLEMLMAAPGPDRLRVTAFSEQGKPVLTEMPSDRLSSPVLARLGSNLVLSGVLDGGAVELVAWTPAQAAQKHRVRSPHSYAGATWNEQRGMVLFQSSDDAYEAVEVTFDQKWRELGRRTLNEAEVEKLTGDERERKVEAGSKISVERAWNRQASEWLFVRRAPTSGADLAESWLLRDSGSGAVWEVPDRPVREPPGAPAGCTRGAAEPQTP